MTTYGDKVQLAIARIGRVRVDDLIESVKSQGWSVTATDSLEELLALADSETHHLVVIAAETPRELPAVEVRALLSLQPEASVIFLVPDRDDLWDSRALLGITSDQVQNLSTSPAELTDVLKNELQSVFASRPEYTVMCVDDDEFFLGSLEELLCSSPRSGYPGFALKFEFFQDPLSALEAVGARSESLAVAICDQVMPGMQGTDLLNRIKEISPRARRVLLTGYAGLESAIRAINERLLDKYLIKPIREPTDFVNSVQHLVREYHLGLKAAAQRRRLMTQFEFLRAITGAAGMEKVLSVSAEFLQSELRARWTALLLSQDGGFTVRAVAGRSPAAMLGESPKGINDLCARALRLDRPMFLSCVEELPPGVGAECFPLPLVTLPLRLGSTHLGAIMLSAERCGGSFGGDERILMSFVAEIASVAIGGFKDRDALEDHYVGTMASLMDTVEAKDHYTRGHTDRVQELAVTLGRAVGVDEEQLKGIQRAAALHDIGKLAISDEILKKPGKLEPQEYAVVKEHPSRGDEILRHLRFLTSARLIVRGHHERFDGKGYPDGLTGEEIPLGARILAIADTFDAMTSERPYRGARRPHEALAEMETNAGTQFDPKLTVIFVRMMRDILESQPAHAAIEASVTNPY